MATSITRSSPCMLVLMLVLGASLLETCMANKELATTQLWGWGRGWGWGWGRGWRRGWSRGGGVHPRTRTPSPPPAPPAYNFSHSGSGSGCPSENNITRGSGGPNKIIVGGSNNWNFGFNYSDWALKNGPFYLNDVLVFKYNAPVNSTAPGHSVYLLPDFWSYLNCDLSQAKRVATTNQGGGEGFEFKLTKWQPHYFACGEHNGIHCNLGMMKFFVMPIFRNSN